MSEELWTAVDRYICQALLPRDPVLDETLQVIHKEGMPIISVPPTHGKLLMLLAKSQGASRILEIGTLGGYSTIWLARALPPGGQLISLESIAKHAKIASENIEHVGLKNVEIIVGPALDTLPSLAQSKHIPFDFIFIDADKPNNPNYFNWALKLSRPGSIIIVDNVVRQGEVLNNNSDDPKVIGTRQLYELLSKETRVSCTAIQTVGSKGHDGFIFAVVND